MDIFVVLFLHAPCDPLFDVLLYGLPGHPFGDFLLAFFQNAGDGVEPLRRLYRRILEYNLLKRSHLLGEIPGTHTAQSVQAPRFQDELFRPVY